MHEMFALRGFLMIWWWRITHVTKDFDFHFSLPCERLYGLGGCFIGKSICVPFSHKSLYFLTLITQLQNVLIWKAKFLLRWMFLSGSLHFVSLVFKSAPSTSKWRHKPKYLQQANCHTLLQVRKGVRLWGCWRVARCLGS